MIKEVSAAVAFALMLAAMPARAQTPTELRARYSVPIREVYLVRPGIVATVTYGAQGTACLIEIVPLAALRDPDSSDAVMAPATVDAVVDELVPAERRGAALSEYDAEWSRIGQLATCYEHAVVYRKTMGVRREITLVRIEWKDSGCP